MNFGRFRIFVHNHGFLRLDGGAMFGSVPKSLWSQEMPADSENRILLATRSLLIKDGLRTFMVDAGNGDKWTEKLRTIFGIEDAPDRGSEFRPEAVTDLILTHLHFDHAGGASRYGPGSSTDIEAQAFAAEVAPRAKPGALTRDENTRLSTAEADPQTKPGAPAAAPAAVELRYPEARVYVQAENFETAKKPNAREKASYLKDNVFVLEKARLDLTRGSAEIHPEIWVHQGNGHTRGLQWVEVRNGDESVVFPSDMIPTSRHLPLPYTMGYDMCTATLLGEKEDFLRRAAAGNWIVVFEHDPDVPAARIGLDARGRYGIRERISL